MRLALAFLLFAEVLAAQTFPAVQKKRFWPDARGEIRITENGIEFQKAGEEALLRWSYPDIQHFDRLSRTEFVVLTYEDQRWKLGRDRRYHFQVTSGELTNESFERIRNRLGKPVTNRVVAALPPPEYELPVKHLHALGGCEGNLIFTPEAVYYSTPHEEDVREWRLNEEIQSVWSADPFYLELHIYEDNRREFGRTRIYKFTLKEPLDPEFYRRLKLKLYGLDASRARTR